MSHGNEVLRANKAGEKEETCQKQLLKKPDDICYISAQIKIRRVLLKIGKDTLKMEGHVT